MSSSKNGRWIITFKKFSWLMIKPDQPVHPDESYLDIAKNDDDQFQ